MKNKTLFRTIVVVILVLGIIGGGYWLWNYLSKADEENVYLMKASGLTLSEKLNLDYEMILLGKLRNGRLLALISGPVEVSEYRIRYVGKTTRHIELKNLSTGDIMRGVLYQDSDRRLVYFEIKDETQGVYYNFSGARDMEKEIPFIRTY